MRTALILSLLAWASLSLPICPLSRTLVRKPEATRLRAIWKLLPLASSTKRSLSVACFLAQLGNPDRGTLLKIFSTIAAAGVGPRTSAAVKLSGWASKPMTRSTGWESWFIFGSLTVVQADGNRSGAYMHSGMRGGPHVGALRRCSFTNTRNYPNGIHEHLPQAHLLV